MKRSTVSFVLVSLLIAILPSLTGCAGQNLTPEQQWHIGAESLAGTMKVLRQQNELGILPDEDFVATEIYVKAANEALNNAKQYLPDGGDGFEVMMGAFTSLLQEIASYQE